MKPRFVYIHGNQTMHWSFAWSKWLKKELELAGFETFFETMPDSIIARSDYWLPFLKNHVKVGENDVIIGWSTGAVAAMRYAEHTRIKGSILVAPCHTDLGDEDEKISGYYNTPWDWNTIRTNQDSIALLWGDDDPFIPQEEFNHIAKQLNPVCKKIPNAGHFIKQTEFPELLTYINQTYK